MVAFPLYRPQKSGGPGQGGASMVIGQLRDRHMDSTQYVINSNTQLLKSEYSLSL